MGYMGFGMQKWIYSRTPRKKLFKRGKIPSYNSVPKYSREFKLRPHLDECKTSSVYVKLIIGILVVVICLFFLVQFNTYSKTNQKHIVTSEHYHNTKAFQFLIQSGKLKLQRNTYIDAYREFKLAAAIFPDNQEVNQLLTETLVVLCERDTKYCLELDEILTSNL